MATASWSSCNSTLWVLCMEAHGGVAAAYPNSYSQVTTPVATVLIGIKNFVTGQSVGCADLHIK